MRLCAEGTRVDGKASPAAACAAQHKARDSATGSGKSKRRRARTEIPWGEDAKNCGEQEPVRAKCRRHLSLMSLNPLDGGLRLGLHRQEISHYIQDPGTLLSIKLSQTAPSG